jgi:hypothetical protein
VIAPLLAAAVAIASPPPTPARVPRSFAATVGTASLVWRSPEQTSYRGAGQPYVQRQGVDFFGAQGGLPARVVRNAYAARPDRFSELWSRLQDPVDIVLARARGKTLQLASTSVAGRPAWRASIGLPRNECAGFARGTQTVWIARDTLLPLQIRGRTQATMIGYRAVNTPVPPALFAPPALGKHPQRLNQGFVRTTPARAAAKLSYGAELPENLPSGFTLAVSGWAPRSARTGPEAGNPRYAQLFAAVYRRGWEHIDVTQRLAGKTGWIDDPFGFECGSEQASKVDLGGGVKATYAAGAEIVPHLYWRAGRVLHTISGPFPAATLAAVARSLEPVGG